MYDPEGLDSCWMMLSVLGSALMVSAAALCLIEAWGSRKDRDSKDK